MAKPINYLEGIEWTNDDLKPRNVFNNIPIESIKKYPLNTIRNQRLDELSYDKWIKQNGKEIKDIYDNFCQTIEETENDNYAIFDKIDFSNFSIFVYNYCC